MLQEHDFVGGLTQMCLEGDVTPLDPEANFGGCRNPGPDCAGANGCGWGAGVLITPTIVAGSGRGKITRDSLGDTFAAPLTLMRASSWFRSIDWADDTARGQFSLAWTIGPEMRGADADHIVALTAFYEHRLSGIDLYSAHPHAERRVDNPDSNNDDLLWEFVIPPREDWGTPMQRVVTAASTDPAPSTNLTYDLYRQMSGDPLDADDGPASELALFTLRRRIAPELGGPRPTPPPIRPIFQLTDGRSRPSEVTGTLVTMFDYGDADGHPNYGFRTSGQIRLSACTDSSRCIGGLPFITAQYDLLNIQFGMIHGALYQTASGVRHRVVLGMDQGLPNPSGGAGDPLVIAEGPDQGRLISTTSHSFLGDRALERWLDPDGDGIYRGELDAWNGVNLPSATGPDPVNCTDAPDFDCLRNNDNCDAVWNLDQADTDGDGIGDDYDLCPLFWEPIIADHVTRLGTTIEPNPDRHSLRPDQMDQYPAATCIARRSNPADTTSVVWHDAVHPGDVIGVACGEPASYSFADGTSINLNINNHTSRSQAFLRVINDTHTEANEAELGIDTDDDGAINFAGTSFPNQDDDGLPYLCDNCPEVPNPDQRDCDGDGEGDACSHFGDSDGDGIPNNCDLCPQVPTSLNAPIDCNSDAELARVATVLQDMCDPTPCARVAPVAPQLVPSTPAPSAVTEVRLRGDAVIASARPTIPATRDFTGSGNVGFRWCRCALATSDDEATRRRCALTAACVLVPADPATDLYANDPTGAWSPIAARLPPGLTEVPTTFHRLGFASSTEIDVAWPFTTDPAVLPLSGPPGPPTARGVLWTQVRASPLCADASDPALCQQLAAHYWSGGIVGGTVHGPNPGLVSGIAMVPWPAPQPICTFCDGSFPAAFLGNTCETGALCLPDTWVVRTAQIEETAAPQLSAALGKHFLDPIVTWTLPSEPRGVLGSEAIRMVGSSVGQVVARVTAVGSGLGLIEELGNNLPKPPQIELALATRALATTGSPNPTGRGTLLLGNERRLITLGGDVVEREDLVFTDLVSGDATPVHLTGDRPGVVLAATHRLLSPSALVLDRVPSLRRRHRYDRGYHDDREHVRLLLVELQNANSRVVTSLPWANRFDRHALVTLANGDSVLVASSTASHRHRVVRFRVTQLPGGPPQLELLAVAEGAGEMIAPPIASLEGVSIAVRPRGRAWTVVGYALPLRSGRPERGLDDCF